MAKPLTPADRAKKLETIRGRVRDIHQHSAEDIKKNEIRKFGMFIFAEMQFLLDEIDRRDGKATPVEETEDELAVA